MPSDNGDGEFRTGAGTMGILGFLGGLAGVASTVSAAKTAIETVAPHFFGGGYGSQTGTAVDAGNAIVRSDGDVSLLQETGISGTDLGIRGYAQGVERLGALVHKEDVVPRWVLRLAGGTTIAAVILEEYRRWRRAGANHKTAKRRAHQRAGIHTKHRRMRPTNIHALRRAVRRLRGFQRIVRKVRGVLPHRGMTHHIKDGWRRRPRRGDLYMVEDFADEMAEAEDYGIEPEFFPEEGE